MHTGIHLTLTAATEPTLWRAGLEQEKGLPGWAQDAPFKVAKPSNMPVCPHATHKHMPASVSTPRESKPHALLLAVSENSLILSTVTPQMASPSFGDDSKWREMELVLSQSMRRVAYSTASCSSCSSSTLVAAAAAQQIMADDCTGKEVKQSILDSHGWNKTCSTIQKFTPRCERVSDSCCWERTSSTSP